MLAQTKRFYGIVADKILAYPLKMHINPLSVYVEIRKCVLMTIKDFQFLEKAKETIEIAIDEKISDILAQVYNKNEIDAILDYKFFGSNKDLL